MAKRFFYVAMGILALSMAYNLGANQASAQSGGAFAGISVSVQGTMANTLAITSNGDVYGRSGAPQCSGDTMIWNNTNCEWQLMGNVVTGPVPVSTQSFGSLKGQFK